VQAVDDAGHVRKTGGEGHIRFRGDKINPEAIEAVLMSYPGVVHAVAFGRPNALGIEEVWAAVEARSEINPETVRVHCAQKLGREMVPARVFRVPAMPRNAGDKIDRAQVIKLADSV
jgi:fatty-acyl-CoA synthase